MSSSIMHLSYSAEEYNNLLIYRYNKDAIMEKVVN